MTAQKSSNEKGRRGVGRSGGNLSKKRADKLQHPAGERKAGVREIHAPLALRLPIAPPAQLRGRGGFPRREGTWDYPAAVKALETALPLPWTPFGRKHGLSVALRLATPYRAWDRQRHRRTRPEVANTVRPELVISCKAVLRALEDAGILESGAAVVSLRASKVFAKSPYISLRVAELKGGEA